MKRGISFPVESISGSYRSEARVTPITGVQAVVKEVELDNRGEDNRHLDTRDS